MDYKGNIFLRWVCIPLYCVIQKAVKCLNGVQDKRMFCHRFRLPGKLLCPLGLYDPADPTGLELSEANRDAVCSLWQAPISSIIA